MESVDPGPRTVESAAARSFDGPPDGRRSDKSPLGTLARFAEARLGRHVVGQAGAIDSVARAVRRAAAGLSGGRAPLSAMLFLGPTGTGKTELARALAQELGGPSRLVRVDCSEFGGSHETAKLLGAPPGYVGHERGGVLGKRLRAKHECVVLFDEIEKGHAKLHELLLQVLDEGRMTDGRGEELDFRRSFVILTSNVGANELQAAKERVGFTRKPPQPRAAEETLQRALRTTFPPEFLARLDEIVLFHELAPERLREVAAQRLLDLALRVRAREKRVCFTAAVARWAAGQASAGMSGARGVLHLIRREIETPLADVLLAAEEGEWIEVSIRRGRPHFAHAA